MYHVLTKDDVPLHRFISGGAGVGKTVLTRQLIASLTVYYDKKAGVPAAAATGEVRESAPYVLIMALTGEVVTGVLVVKW
jgi:F0F1-type ATP synthase beta subunit